MSHAPSLPLVALVALGLGATAAAQGVDITDANVHFTQVRPTTTQADSPTATFTANAAGDTNIQFEDGWYYRIEGDPQNNPLKADGALSIVNAGAHSDANWADVDARGLISILIDYDALSTSATSGVVLQRLQIQNISASPVTVHLFHYSDLDMCSFSSNQVTGSGNRHIINRASCTETGYHFAPLADRFCVAEFSADECGIRTGPSDLDNSVPPFTGDYTGAFQWTFEDIPPIQTVDRMITVALGHNENPCAWGVDVYGENAPTSTGIVTMEQDSGFPPVIGAATASVGIVRNYPAGSTLLACKGIARLDVDIIGTGLKLQVDPLICLTLANPPGAFRLVFNNFIPNDPVLCGLEVHHQLFAIDSGSPNGIGGYPKPASWTIGAY